MKAEVHAEQFVEMNSGSGGIATTVPTAKGLRIGQACFGWPRAGDGLADERPIWDRHVSATDARWRLGAGY